MTCRYIYNAALALLGEPEDTDATKDYAVRSVHLLTVIFSRFAKLSEALSGALTDFEALTLTSLDSPFPLDQRLAALVSEVLASMLVTDELPEISKMLAQRAEKDTLALSAEAVSIGSTREVYGL